MSLNALTKFSGHRFFNAGSNRIDLTPHIDDVLRFYSPLLPVPDVYHRNFERWAFGQSAGGVSNHQIQIFQAAQIHFLAQVVEKTISTRFGFTETRDFPVDLPSVGIGIGFGKDSLDSGGIDGVEDVSRSGREHWWFPE